MSDSRSFFDIDGVLVVILSIRAKKADYRKKTLLLFLFISYLWKDFNVVIPSIHGVELKEYLGFVVRTVIGTSAVGHFFHTVLGSDFLHTMLRGRTIAVHCYNRWGNFRLI